VAHPLCIYRIQSIAQQQQQPPSPQRQQHRQPQQHELPPTSNSNHAHCAFMRLAVNVSKQHAIKGPIVPPSGIPTLHPEVAHQQPTTPTQQQQQPQQPQQQQPAPTATTLTTTTSSNEKEKQFRTNSI
jgi:hypothetical protein